MVADIFDFHITNIVTNNDISDINYYENGKTANRTPIFKAGDKTNFSIFFRLLEILQLQS